MISLPINCAYSKILFFSIIIFFSFSNAISNTRTQIIIGISKASGSESYHNYGNWLKKLDSSVKIVDFYNLNNDSALKLLNLCDGLVLSGGPDVHPVFYNRPQDKHLCSIDNKRDTLEFALIKAAIKRKIPIFAICRGLQILNVALGGTLIADIPTQFQSNVVHQNQDKSDSYHNIKINNQTKFKEVFGFIPKNDIVNSNHHQGIDKLANELEPLGKSEDGLIEIFTWKNTKTNPFMVAMQWHPERLYEKNPELSDSLGIKFLNEIKKNIKHKHKNRR